MSKKDDELKGSEIFSVPANCIRVDPDGEVIFHKEEEMLARIAKMEGLVKSWVDGLLDLNERMRHVNASLEALMLDSANIHDALKGSDVRKLEQLERDVKKGDVAWSEMKDLVTRVADQSKKLVEFVDLKTKDMEDFRRAHLAYHEDSLDIRIDGIYKFMDEIKKYLDNEKNPRGGWDDGGTKQDP